VKRNTYYNRPQRIWVSFKTDSDGFQVGPCGYGMNRKEAEEDCDYQCESANRWFEPSD
jgi:hypothetical protein